MNKKLKVTISIIASMIIIMGSAFTIYAATTEYSLKSHGIIAHDGDGDGAYTNTAKDIYIDSGDLKTINDAVVAGKTSLASAINSATASSATNKTTLGTTDANLPAFNDLKNAIAKVKAAGNEEGYATGNAAGIITGQNNVINNVGGKTSASLGADGSLTLSYDGTTGTSSVGNPTWAAIENKLSGKTDADGNPIYSGITDLDSLENAITADNDNCSGMTDIKIHNGYGGQGQSCPSFSYRVPAEYYGKTAYLSISYIYSTRNATTETFSIAHTGLNVTKTHVSAQVTNADSEAVCGKSFVYEGILQGGTIEVGLSGWDRKNFTVMLVVK